MKIRQLASFFDCQCVSDKFVYFRLINLKEFTTALSSSNETGKVTGNLETKYKNAKHGKVIV